MAIHRRIAHRLDRKLRGERRRAERGENRRSTDLEPNRGWKPAAVIAITIALLDWAVKYWIVKNIPLNSLEVVWENRVALWHVRNDAMILGLYGSLPIGVRIGIAAASGIMGVTLLFQVVSRGHRLAPAHRKWAWAFVGLALGGMLGNLGERLIHWGVTDYLSFAYHDLWLPPGNVADLSIFLSMPLAVLVVFFELQARTMRSTDNAPESALTADV